MTYENAAPEFEYEDQHCNTVTLINVESGATEVVVRCEGKVDTEDNAGVIGARAGHFYPLQRVG